MTQIEDEAAKFLKRDFHEAFQEKRHLESLTWQALRFAFTAYSAVVGVALGLHQYSLTSQVDFTPVAQVLLAIGLLVGGVMYLLTLRNRVYFVVVTRYINEHRNFYLKRKPMGFPNATGMYVDKSKPPYFSWRSSQSWTALLIAVLNSVVAGALAFVFTSQFRHVWYLTIAIFLVLLLVQVIGAITYLASREQKDPTAAVFGPEVNRTTELNVSKADNGT